MTPDSVRPRRASADQLFDPQIYEYVAFGACCHLFNPSRIQIHRPSEPKFSCQLEDRELVRGV